MTERPIFPEATWEGASVTGAMIVRGGSPPKRRPWRCWFRPHTWEFAWLGPFLARGGEEVSIGSVCSRCGKFREAFR